MRDTSAETGLLIGYSKWKAAGYLLLYVGLASMCVYGLTQGKWLAIIGVPVCGWGMFVRGKALLTRQHQLWLNERGIQLNGRPLDSWRVVRNPEICTERIGRRTLVYLRYQAGSRPREIEISDLDIEAELLEAWIAEYRAAYQAPAATAGPT